jgi:hypothetical protein
MRVIAGSARGITREHVIGTTSSYEYKEGKVRRGDNLLGGPCIGTRQSGAHIRLRQKDAGFCGRQCRGGHRDLGCSRFSMLVVHDDAEREFAYTKAAQSSVVAAKEKDWTLVCMKNDWNTVFSLSSADGLFISHCHRHPQSLRGKYLCNTISYTLPVTN